MSKFSRSSQILITLGAASIFLVLLLSSQPAEAGKSTKRMVALALMSMLNKNQKIIIPFPVPMPIKVYEAKKDYYYKEDYGHGYGDEGYGGHHGGHHGGLGGHSAFAGAGVGHLGGGGLAYKGGHEGGFHTPSYNSHSMVNAYDGKVAGGEVSDYGGSGGYEEAKKEGAYGGGADVLSGY